MAHEVLESALDYSLSDGVAHIGMRRNIGILGPACDWPHDDRTPFSPPVRNEMFETGAEDALGNGPSHIGVGRKVVPFAEPLSASHQKTSQGVGQGDFRPEQ